MKKEKVWELWQDKMAGELGEKESKQLDEYLSKNESVAKELQEITHTWELFDDINRPEPSPQMDAKFEGMMAAYAAASKSRSVSLDSLVDWFTRSWKVSLASMVIGLFAGWMMLPSSSQNKDIAQLSDEIQGMKEMMMLTLIEQPKAQERIRAVNMAAELPNADDKVIEALIMTLLNDENTNVRLAALESLLRYNELPEVREAMIEAIKQQGSPILMVAIADALVAIQEKSSIDALRAAKESTENDLVREKLSESINQLTNS